MILVLALAYLGGVLTILSPCILPVLPFVFARADRPFLKHGLPMLVGMAVTFAGVATLTAAAGEWAAGANSAGRTVALVVMALFALMLIFPSLSDRAMAPVARLGDRLSGGSGGGGGPLGSALLGVATGLLWAPCAGPILGLILTGAALSGASGETALLLLAYALGAATSLGAALLVGGKLFAAMKRSLGAGQRIRKALGVLILLAAATIALGLDTRVLARLSSGSTSAIEQSLTKLLGMDDRELTTRTMDGMLPDEGPFPGLDGASSWLGEPLEAADLEGKVVLVDFWTYSCINCIRTVPFIEALHRRYAKDGLVIVGVHSPEFAFERDPANVAKAVREQGISYAVAIDNDKAVWRAFENRFWPASYLRDADGRLRYHHFGEGGERATENAIRRLLTEAGATLTATRAREERGAVQQRADFAGVGTRETYLGWGRAKNNRNAAPEIAQDRREAYALPALEAVGDWALGGAWTVERQRAIASDEGAKIVMRFSARDLHLVLGSTDGAPKRIEVLLDGQPPGADAGVDIASDGTGTITDERLYNLVRQDGGARARTIEIRVEEGSAAYAFTFG